MPSSTKQPWLKKAKTDNSRKHSPEPPLQCSAADPGSKKALGSFSACTPAPDSLLVPSRLPPHAVLRKLIATECLRGLRKQECILSTRQVFHSTENTAAATTRGSCLCCSDTHPFRQDTVHGKYFLCNIPKTVFLSTTLYTQNKYRSSCHQEFLKHHRMEFNCRNWRRCWMASGHSIQTTLPVSRTPVWCSKGTGLKLVALRQQRVKCRTLIFVVVISLYEAVVKIKSF